MARLDPENTHLMIIHVARSNVEMMAISDMNNPRQEGMGIVARDRQAELDML